MAVFAGNIIYASDVNTVDRFLWASLSADSSTNSTVTMTDTTGLAVTLVASSTYRIDCLIIYTVATANDFALGITQPTGATTIAQPLSEIQAATNDDAAARWGVGTVSATSGTLVFAGGAGAGTSTAVRMKAKVVVGTTGGAWQIQHAVQVAGGGATVKSGSFIEAVKQA